MISHFWQEQLTGNRTGNDIMIPELYISPMPCCLGMTLQLTRKLGGGTEPQTLMQLNSNSFVSVSPLHLKKELKILEQKEIDKFLKRSIYFLIIYIYRFFEQTF